MCLADEAACKDTSGTYETSYTCEGFVDARDFGRHLDRGRVPRSSRGLSFILRDSRPRDFPVGWLEGVNATLLEFQNVTLTSPESYDAVLSRLAGDAPPSSVERLVFRYVWSSVRLAMCALDTCTHVILYTCMCLLCTGGPNWHAP